MARRALRRPAAAPHQPAPGPYAPGPVDDAPAVAAATAANVTAATVTAPDGTAPDVTVTVDRAAPGVGFAIFAQSTHFVPYCKQPETPKAQIFYLFTLG
jgi:hypothetical protein